MTTTDNTTPLAVYEAIPANASEIGGAVFDHNGIHWSILDVPHRALRVDAACTIDHADAERLFVLAKDVLEMYFSETTNNDACKVRITEQSAHFPDDDEFRIEVTAELLDYLT